MASTNARSLWRSRDLSASSNKLQSCVTLDAALERCGNGQHSGTGVSGACCDFELSQLSQACRTCSQPDTTADSCSAATSAVDVALGMSRCKLQSSSPGFFPSLVGGDLHPSRDSPRQHPFAARDADSEYTGPSMAFLGAFFAALALLALGIGFVMWRRYREVQPARKRAQRREVLDLTAGSPVDEKKQDWPPWVRFQPDAADAAVSPPPQARSRTPSPVADDMYHEVPLTGLPMPGARPGQMLPQFGLPPPRYENRATVLPSPVDQPVPIRRY